MDQVYLWKEECTQHLLICNTVPIAHAKNEDIIFLHAIPIHTVGTRFLPNTWQNAFIRTRCQGSQWGDRSKESLSQMLQPRVLVDN